MVSTIDERVAFLEGRVQEHSQGLAELREMVMHLDQKVDRRFEGVERRFDLMDRRFENVDRRFESVDLKLDQLQDRMGRQFQWTVGIQIAVMIAVVGALAAG